MVLRRTRLPLVFNVLAGVSLATLVALLGASSRARARGTDPPAGSVTRVHVLKGAHRMDLFRGDTKVASYRVALGPGGPGVKHREGDQVTPVGHYHVVSKGPSRYATFMLLDYPNAEDRIRFAQARAAGDLPRDATIGGAIGIHGAPPQRTFKAGHKLVDWTLGCIAVDDDEIAEVASLVPVGTVVDIED